jgi:hypothetical protein
METNFVIYTPSESLNMTIMMPPTTTGTFARLYARSSALGVEVYGVFERAWSSQI